VPRCIVEREVHLETWTTIPLDHLVSLRTIQQLAGSGRTKVDRATVAYRRSDDPLRHRGATGCAVGYDRQVLGDRPLMAFIPVRDLDAARSFYGDVLGLSVTEEGPYAVVLDAGGTMLRLAPVDDLQSQPFTIAGWQVLDMGMSIDDLKSRGVRFIKYEGMDQDERGIWSTPSGDQVAWFNDPDGNTLSLTCFAE
jgi:catechol 2,3-dioxygenase-like lactoylglutathione lyase family enzyme